MRRSWRWVLAGLVVVAVALAISHLVRQRALLAPSDTVTVGDEARGRHLRPAISDGEGELPKVPLYSYVVLTSRAPDQLLKLELILAGLSSILGSRPESPAQAVGIHLVVVPVRTDKFRHTERLDSDNIGCVVDDFGFELSRQIVENAGLGPDFVGPAVLTSKVELRAAALGDSALLYQDFSNVSLQLASRWVQTYFRLLWQGDSPDRLGYETFALRMRDLIAKGGDAVDVVIRARENIVLFVRSLAGPAGAAPSGTAKTDVIRRFKCQLPRGK